MEDFVLSEDLLSDLPSGRGIYSVRRICSERDLFYEDLFYEEYALWGFILSDEGIHSSSWCCLWGVNGWQLEASSRPHQLL